MRVFLGVQYTPHFFVGFEVRFCLGVTVSTAVECQLLLLDRRDANFFRYCCSSPSWQE